MPPDDSARPKSPLLPRHILGSLPRIAEGDETAMEELMRDRQGGRRHRVVITQDPRRGPLWVRPERPLTELEEIAVMRAFYMAEQLALAQEVLFRGDTTPEQREQALWLIDHVHDRAAIHEEGTARWLSLAEALDAVPETWGMPLAPEESCILRAMLSADRPGGRSAALVAVTDAELSDLLSAWRAPKRGRPKWGVFLDFCRHLGLRVPREEGAAKQAYQRHQQKKKGGT